MVFAPLKGQWLCFTWSSYVHVTKVTCFLFLHLLKCIQDIILIVTELWGEM